MDNFGDTSSRNMPAHLFWGSLHLDHDNAVQADISRQNYTVCPRHWYVDATFRCSTCGESFVFSAAEQKFWYEELGFYVDSRAKNCLTCRRNERRKKALRQQYDRDVEVTLRSGDLQAKRALAEVIDELLSMDDCLPARIHDNRKQLAGQIARLERKVGE